MLLYSKARGSTHVVDVERLASTGEERLVCGRELFGGSTKEIDRLPTCLMCLAALRRMEAQFDTAEPTTSISDAPRALADESDFICPVCGEPMGLGAKRYSFPGRLITTVRATLVLVCNNVDGHKGKP